MDLIIKIVPNGLQANGYKLVKMYHKKLWESLVLLQVSSTVKSHWEIIV